MGNLKQLRQLLTNEWTLVGTVDSIDTVEGTSIIKTENGNKLKVRGTSVQVGNKAIVKNGAIISAAPSVVYYEYEV
jgi:hypothetical protein